MKKNITRKLSLFVVAALLMSQFFISSAYAYTYYCWNQYDACQNNITNGNFETGNLSGWTVTGNAFSVTNDTNWGWGGDFNHNGNYHVWGYKNAGDAGTGTLTSKTVNVYTGSYENKYIDFLIGGGNDIDNLYVALIDANTGEVLAKATGTNSESYRRVVWDVTPWMSKQVYFKVVDNDTGAWGHINVDDFHTTYDSAFGRYSSKLKYDFEDGTLKDWKVMSGTAFSAEDVTNDTTYWGGSFDQQGQYHLWGFKNGGDADTGVLQSDLSFEIGGMAQINFLISGGEDINNLYVALVRVSDGKELFKATGSNTERYSRVTWDAGVYMGEQVKVKIVDNATGDWGHISIDDLNAEMVYNSFYY